MSNNDVPPGIDPALWNTDYVNEDDLAAFGHALELSDQQVLDGYNTPGVKSPLFGPQEDYASAPGWAKGVEPVTATSDFAPIHQRVRKGRSHRGGHSLGLTYHLVRWPLLAFFFLIISFEFGAYVMTRQVVNVFEWTFAWRGKKRQLRKGLRSATTFEEWKDKALQLDECLGFEEWKETDDDSYFDWHLVRRVRSTLSRLRAQRDTRGLMDALAVCVRPNFAGTESTKMYSETYYGTKHAIEEHVDNVAAALDYVRTATDVSLQEKRAFFRAINNNYGSSALCLSGGASFGYYHFGVIKAFLDADLLPRVITGTSAGGLIAALVGTHTDAELKQLIQPILADKITACEDPFTVWFKRWWETGARFSAREWAKKAMFFTRGSLTFKEAYELTGRALNVSVVPADRHSPTILLNHLTAPHCIIWSAIIASAAVPGILNPVVLMAKDRHGKLVPHNLGGSRFKDGSLREDIPLGSLHTQFNCNFSIVSQTNPHIHLFFFAPRGSVGRPVAHRKGKGWRGGFILSALERYIKLDLSKHFKVIRDLDLMPQLLQSDWSGVFLQRFEGDLTFTPRSTVWDWLHLLDDPDPKQLARMIGVGQRVAFPALHMVSNRSKIEKAVMRGRAEVRIALQRDRPNTDPDSGNVPARTLTPLPIESDADAAIAIRARRSKSAHDLLLPDAGRTPRRKGTRRLESRSETHRDAPPRLSVTTAASAQQAPDVASSQGPKATATPSTYTTAMAGTLGRLRTASQSAFTTLRLRTPEQVRPPRTPRRLSRWFSGGATDSEDDMDYPSAAAPAWSASAADPGVGTSPSDSDNSASAFERERELQREPSQWALDDATFDAVGSDPDATASHSDEGLRAGAGTSAAVERAPLAPVQESEARYINTAERDIAPKGDQNGHAPQATRRQEGTGTDSDGAATVPRE